ncbi:MAG: hypothetical protein SH848_06500 [Saprospiraceae bacterium]|nr:hypothetical protein [Saprospiraceae bacterium]
MHTEDYDIATIEQYLAGQLEAEATARFEAQLAQDEALKADTAQYRRLFDGLGALRSQAYRDKFAGWEADAQLAESAAEYAPVLEGLAALRSEHLRGKMAGWEAAHQNKTPVEKTAVVKTLRPVFVRRLAVAASILLLVGAGLSWYASQHYSAESLVADYYRMPNIGNTMGGEQTMRSRLESRFADAHRLMEKKSYSEALIAFGEVLTLSRAAGLDETRMRYYSDQVSWNRVLILLAQKAPEPELRAALDQVLADPQNEYQGKAEALRGQLDGFWRKLVWYGSLNE